jgi:hypothetical protein
MALKNERSGVDSLLVEVRELRGEYGPGLRVETRPNLQLETCNLQLLGR